MYSPLSPKLPGKAGASVRWGNLFEEPLALCLVNATQQAENPLVFIGKDILQTQKIYDICRFLNKDKQLDLIYFPDRETLPYDSFSPHQDLVSSRLKALVKIPFAQKAIIFIAATTAAHYLCPKAYLETNAFALKTSEKINLSQFKVNMENRGYVHVSQVMAHGEYAVRGSIIDIYPMGLKNPVRVDLFDDEIDSIRYFNVDDQLSTHKVDAIELLPAHEFPLDENGISLFRKNWREKFTGNPSQSPVYQNITSGLAIAGCEYYLPLFFNKCVSFFDYLPATTLIVRMKTIEDSLERFLENVQYRFEQYGYDISRPLLKPQELFLAENELLHLVNGFQNVIVEEHQLMDKTGYYNFNIEKSPELFINRKLKSPLEKLTEHLKNQSTPIIFSVESKGRREALLELLQSHGIKPISLDSWQQFLLEKPLLSILVTPFETGFIIPNTVEFITEAQLSGEKIQQKSRQKPSKYQHQLNNAVRNLLELNVGDAIVHIEHGIGRYQGLQTLKVTEKDQEFLVITYADKAKLYVPVTSLHLISRYGGAENSKHIPISRLGTEQWSKAKQKAAEKIRDVAAELLEIYAKREAKQGNIYHIKDNYKKFAEEFPFEETPDQARAIEDILKDMNSPKTMDRLVCGDVGFGKTEVAMRAAFMMVENQKQVVVLAPTTLLAQQHFQTFLDRFAQWPIRIEVLSRFKSKKETEEILAQLKKGAIDIIIGTHKLIQKNVVFKTLGLLIIDEEHRFGVQQKEQLKKYRSEVDILTLTATPIPRTLNMSLSGIRDLSLITTPPLQRLSIKTFVYERQKSIIKEAILRELQRGGQIYFLHNNVETIEKTAFELNELIPDLKIAVAHGQMREKQLEQVMSDFYHHRINILVCTTIIESGIDVPTANTIIMDRADRLGLAQLHQLRGRVGRSHHQAYAYLLTPNPKAMTKDAAKRLEAIASHEDLGSGFMLANQDLEIRGAGEFLGEEQSGQMQAVGFSLYMELLQRAVNSLKAGHVPDISDVFTQNTEIEISLPTLIPEDYVPDIHTRLILYKRISNCKTTAQLDELKIEFIDRFGLMPDALKNLFAATQIKLICEKMGIKKLEANLKQGKIHFSSSPDIDSAKLIKLIQIKPRQFKLAGQDKLNFFFEKPLNDEQLTQEVTNILSELTSENC